MFFRFLDKFFISNTYINNSPNNKENYNKIQEKDTFDIIGLENIAPDKSLTIVLNHADGSMDEFEVNHSYNLNQIEWLKAGSALNLIKIQNK